MTTNLARALALLAATIASEAAAQSSSPFSRLLGKRDAAASSPVKLDVEVAGDPDGLSRQLRNASLVAGALNDGRFSGQDVLAAARADYARLLGNLYDLGYYSAVIDIKLDGVEAATIAPLDAPASVSRVRIAVQPGPQFHFSRADIAPLAAGTDLPRDYAVGKVAGTGTMKAAATAGVDGWRQRGHAKADLRDTMIVADHAASKIDSRIDLAPGPVVTFGRLNVTGLQRLRESRLRAIAGFPTGDRYYPDNIEAVRKRLRRSGVFSAITLEEADRLGPGNTLDVNLTVVEQKPRRVGGGIEVSTNDGLALSGYWLHRNLFGGAERLRIEGRASDIGSGTSGRDEQLSLRLERPATFGRDFTLYTEIGAERMREEEYTSDTARAGIGVDYFRNDNLSGGVGLQYRFARVTDASGTSRFRLLALPTSGTWDVRDNDINPKTGFWLKATLTPFLGLDDVTGTGLRNELEGRVYRSFGTDDRVTLAGRARVGTILGSSLGQTPRDYLFYSGGGGTVRGQPFQSLGVEELPGPDGPIKTGGLSVANLTAEVRVQVRERIGIAIFADAGKVWSEGAFKGDSGWQAGAGAGIRYMTPIGPIRFDAAVPVGGTTGDRVQLYLGLGQAF